MPGIARKCLDTDMTKGTQLDPLLIDAGLGCPQMTFARMTAGFDGNTFEPIGKQAQISAIGSVNRFAG
jgi:hypothetical protein